MRTSLINSLQGIIYRNYGCKLNVDKIKQSKENHVRPILSGQYNLELSGEVSKDTIDYLIRQIHKIESAILKEIKLRDSFKKLQTVPGIGKILALTIMLETGSIKRFSSVGNFSSYCRKVPTKRTSNDKKKGERQQQEWKQILGLGLFRGCRICQAV